MHLTTFDRLLYNFQAEGEFVLAEATQPGDSYQVQIRLQPPGSSTSVTVMTQIAAAVGSDQVTFGLNRASTVWVDGTPSTLSAANPTVALNGGTLTELSPNHYRIAWDTGETLTATDYASHFGITTQLASNEGPGSIKGLLGSDTGKGNDFQLADGTVIPQPLTSPELYGEFANAWRVTQATSLLDYGSGQTTVTFTNLNFPYHPASLSDFSATAVDQAAQMAAAANITDPNVAAAAELDYLETNNASFITAASDASQSVPDTTPADITPPAATTGFEHITLSHYYPAIIPADLREQGSATLSNGSVDFPNLAALTVIHPDPPGIVTAPRSYDFTDNTITISYPVAWASLPGSYDEITTDPDPAITGLTLLSSTVSGFSQNSISFSAHTIDLNFGGVSSPAGGAIVIARPLHLQHLRSPKSRPQALRLVAQTTIFLSWSGTICWR